MICMCRNRKGINHPSWTGTRVCPECGNKKSQGKYKLCKKCRGYVGKSWWEMENKKPWNIGKPRDLETRNKISQTKILGIKDGSIPRVTSGAFKKGHRWDDPIIVGKMFRNHLRKLPNKKETLLQMILQDQRLPYQYVGNGQFTLGNYCPDFVNTNGQKKIIELFGNYWHKPEEIETRSKKFAEFGFKTLVVWENELKNIPSVISKLAIFHEAV